MKLGEVDGKKIGCTVSLLVSSSYLLCLSFPNIILLTSMNTYYNFQAL